MSKKKRLKKIRESLDQIEGDSVIKQVMGETKYKIMFAPGFEEELEEIEQETPKQASKRARDYSNFLKSKITLDILEKGEVVFVARNFLIDHFLTNGEFNERAYHEHRNGHEPEYTFEEFSKQELPELLKQGIIPSSHLDIVVGEKDYWTAEVFSLLTKDCAKREYLRETRSTINVTNKILANGDYFYTEAKKKNSSWRIALWEGKLKSHEELIGDEKEAKAVRKICSRYLKEKLEELEGCKFEYPDEREWDKENSTLNYYLESINANPFYEKKGRLIFTPSQMKSITVKDMADNFRRWIKKYVKPKQDYNLKYGTLLDEMLVWDKLLKVVQERMSKVTGKDNYRKPNAREQEMKEFQKKYKLNSLPFGKLF